MHPPLPEPHVEVAASPGSVVSDSLSGRLGQPRSPDQVEEVQLGQGMRASGGVRSGLPDQVPAPDPGHAVQDQVEVVASDEALLETGGDDRPSMLVSRRPLRRVHQRPGRHGAGRLPDLQHVLFPELGGPVQAYAGWQGAALVRGRQEHVHDPAVVTA
ncbi:hypothetical protein OG777_09390 [Micromonospora peucetia]|uniref:hypothetical protein n=1 Tax=Micromonospora peucetia TaxID=47871 RepID=UPI00224F5A63|nr:hypothetical protein [Micromonospora peucetia]MCX4387141.1 hypothetical protein [Micromonospora peucetia]